MLALTQGLMSLGGGAAVNTVALLHMNGTNGSTSFPDDVAGNTWTANGNAQVSTTTPQFGSGCLTLDGTGDFLTIPRWSGLAFGTGDFTVEAWIRSSASAANSPNIFSSRATAGLTLRLNTSGVLQYFGGSGSPIISGGAALNDGNWHHVAVCRASGTTRLFRNGTQVASTADSVNHQLAGLSNLAYIGQSAVANEAWNGQIDEFRISNLARYTAGFTPAGPFTLD